MTCMTFSYTYMGVCLAALAIASRELYCTRFSPQTCRALSMTWMACIVLSMTWMACIVLSDLDGMYSFVYDLDGMYSFV